MSKTLGGVRGTLGREQLRVTRSLVSFLMFFGISGRGVPSTVSRHRQ